MNEQDRGNLLKMANEIAGHYEVPSDLLRAVVGHESGWVVDVPGTSGEIGLGQLMPDTARKLGLVVNDQYDDRLHPGRNLDGAARYLKEGYERTGSWKGALSFYNTGRSVETPKGREYQQKVLDQWQKDQEAGMLEPPRIKTGPSEVGQPAQPTEITPETVMAGAPEAAIAKQPLIKAETLSEIGGAAKDMIFGGPRSVMIPEERYQQVAKEAGYYKPTGEWSSATGETKVWEPTPVDVHPGWSKPWEMIGSQLGVGAKMSVGGLVDTYEKLTGPPATDIQKGWMDSLKKMFTVPPEKVGTDLASKVLQGFGAAPIGVAEFGGAMAIGGIPGAMALGALKAPGGVVEKVKGAAEYGLLGGTLRATGGLSLAPRVGAMGAIGGGQAAVAGGDAKDITAGALIMMTLATPGGRRLKEAVDSDMKPADIGKAEWENVKEAVNRTPEPTPIPTPQSPLKPPEPSVAVRPPEAPVVAPTPVPEAKMEGIPVYHATTEPFKPELMKEAIYVSPSEQVAGYFKGKGQIVEKLYLDKDAKILEYKDIPEEIRNIKDWDKYSPAVAKYAKEQGYDAVYSTPPPSELLEKTGVPKYQVEITVVNPTKLTKPEPTPSAPPRPAEAPAQAGAKWDFIDKIDTSKGPGVFGYQKEFAENDSQIAKVLAKKQDFETREMESFRRLREKYGEDSNWRDWPKDDPDYIEWDKASDKRSEYNAKFARLAEDRINQYKEDTIPDLAAKGKGEGVPGGEGEIDQFIMGPTDQRITNLENDIRMMREADYPKKEITDKEAQLTKLKETEPTPTTKMYGGGPDTREFLSGITGKPKPTQPPKDPELAAAQEKIASHISVGEHEKKPWITPTGVYTSMVDRFHPLNKLVMSYGGKQRPSISEDPYKQARLYAGWHGKADAFIEYHPFNRKTMEFENIKPLRDIVKPLEEQGKLQDFRDYLVARRAIERESRGFETGIDLEAAQTVIKGLGPEMEAPAKEFEIYMDATLRYMRDSDMISPERYQQIKAGSTDYAPLLRVFEQEKTIGSGKGFEASQVIKAFKGSKRDIVDPIESGIKLTYAAINASERNRIGLTLINWAEKSGVMGKEISPVSPKMVPYEVKLKEILKSPEARKMLEESGFTEDEAAIFRPSGFRPAKDVISVWQDGKRKYYRVSEDIADIIQGLDEQSTGIFLRIFSGPAQALRLGATTLSPEFGIRNFLKDQFPAFIHSKYGYKPFIDYFKGVITLARGGEEYWKYMISGAPHAELVSLDRRRLQKKLEDVLSGKLTMPGFLVRYPIEAMKILSEYSERGTRIGEFKKALREKGVSAETIQEAGFQSREVTVDFGRRGAATKALNMLTAFWNANIQGLDKVVRAHKTNPLGTMAKALAAVTIPSILLELAFHDDKRYQDLAQWRKDLFFNIPSAVGVISLPRPWTYGLLYGAIPQRLTNYALSKDSHAFDKLLTAIGRELPDFPLPTAFKPFIEAWANKSFFFDRPIVPGWKEGLPPKFQYGPGTSESAKQLGRLISKLPVISDSKMASPAVIDNLVMSWTGGGGRLALNVLDRGLKEAGIVHDIPRASATLADYPIVRAIVARYPAADAEPIKRFYENANKIQAAAQAFKQEGKRLAYQGRGDEIKELQKEFGMDPFIKITKMRATMSNMMKFVEMVDLNPNMAPEEKRIARDKTLTTAIEFAKKTNAMIDKTRTRRPTQ